MTEFFKLLETENTTKTPHILFTDPTGQELHLTISIKPVQGESFFHTITLNHNYKSDIFHINDKKNITLIPNGHKHLITMFQISHIFTSHIREYIDYLNLAFQKTLNRSPDSSFDDDFTKDFYTAKLLSHISRQKKIQKHTYFLLFT